MLKTFLPLVFAYFLYLPVFSEGSLEIVDKYQSCSIVEKAKIYSTYDPHWIPSKSANNQLLFEPLQKKFINFNKYKKIIWIKIELRNKNKVPVYLDMNTSMIDSIEVSWYNKEDQFINKNDRSAYSKFENDLTIPNYVFEIPQDTFTTGYIRIVPGFYSIVVPTIRTHQAMINYYQLFGIANGFYYGFLLLITGYNLLIYLSIKEKLYLYYTLSNIGIGIMNSVMNSYAYQFLWPNFPILNQYQHFVISISAIFSILFLINFLNTKNIFPKIHKGFIIIGFCFVLIAIMDFWGYRNHSANLIQSVSLLFSFYTLYVSIYLYINGVKSAKYIIIAWSFYLLSVIYVIFMFWEIVPFISMGVYIIQFGSSIEIFTLSLAIAAKINDYKTEKELAVRDKLQVMEQNEKYIMDSNTELSRQNLILKQYSYITSHNLRSPVASLLGLTQIFNRTNLSDPFNLVVMEKIKDCASNLDKIILDLTAILNKNDNNMHTFEKVNLEEKLNEVIVSLEAEITINKAIINSDFSEVNHIYAIPSFIHSIFFNLINNSLKYRSKDPLVITVKSFQKNNKTCITVSDNGLGIDLKTNKNKVFGLYQRFHSHKQGRGLGLFMVRNQIESMNGTIEIESEIMQGTTFMIQFKNVDEKSITNVDNHA